LASCFNGLLQIHPSQKRRRSPFLSGENNLKKADYLAVIDTGASITNREPCQTLYPPDRNVAAMKSQPRMIDKKGAHVL